MANNFEAAAFALQCAFPKNKILMDDKGMPSVFVWIPAFRLCDVLSTTVRRSQASTSASTRPRFTTSVRTACPQKIPP